MAEFTKRHADWQNKPSTATPILDTDIEAWETALDKLLGKDTPAVDEVGVWTPASGGLIYQKIDTNQLADNAVTNVKVAAAAAIAYTKLALAGKIKLDSDVDVTTALAIARLAGFPNDATKRLAGDGSWVTPAAGAVAPTFLAGMASGANNSAVVANTAYLMPINNVVTPTSISRIFWGLITLVAGNYDVGIYYSDDEATFTRLVSKGSTAQPAAGAVISTVGATTITPVTGRRWFYAIALSTASSLAVAGSGGLNSQTIPGYLKATSFPLPASLTGMTAAGVTSIPVLNGAV